MYRKPSEKSANAPPTVLEEIRYTFLSSNCPIYMQALLQNFWTENSTLKIPSNSRFFPISAVTLALQLVIFIMFINANKLLCNSTLQFFRGKQWKITEHQTTTNATHARQSKETFQNYGGRTLSLTQVNGKNATAKNGGEEFFAWTGQRTWIQVWRSSELIVNAYWKNIMNLNVMKN